MYNPDAHSLSWERGSVGGRGDNPAESDADLLVFGYSAKLFKDDARAQSIEDGTHLIPWMGNSDVMIDRFDGRGLLNNLKPYESNGKTKEVTPGEAAFETCLDDERYRDLTDVMEAQENEMRRLRAELEVDGAFSQVAYQYDSADTTKEEPVEETKEIDDFVPPDNLKLPVGLNTPRSMKDHNLIEKTAHFISKNGSQMEFILKIKQANNPSFVFLNLDSPLNQYFKYLLSVIKSGKYVPLIRDEEVNAKEETSKETNDANSDTDSDSDGEGYLHPSLFGSSSSKTTAIPAVKSKSDGETSNSSRQLMQSLVGSTESDSDRDEAVPSSHSILDSKDKQPMKAKSWSLLPPPPPALEVIIEKLAERVAQTGNDFEASVKSRGDNRFDFLNPGHCFHAHYVKRKMHHLQQINIQPLPEKEKALLPSTSKTADKEETNNIPEVDDNNGHIDKKLSFSVKSSVDESIRTPRSIANSVVIVPDSCENQTERNDSDEDDEINNLIESTSTTSQKTNSTSSKTELADKLASAARDRMKQEKTVQEERKKKAAQFLSMIRDREEADKKKESKLQSKVVAVKAGQSVLPFTTKDHHIRKESSHRESSSSSSHASSRRHDKHKKRRSRSRSSSRDREDRQRHHKKSKKSRRTRSRSRDN